MEVLQIPITDLKPNERNPRKIKKSELENLKRSIKEFGFQEPVIVNKHKSRENVIIGGHQRVKAAAALGMTTVPVVYVDLPKDKEETFNIALNKISGDWDEEKLAIMLKELLERDADISLTGFAEPEVDKLMDRYEKARKKEEDIDKAPPVPATPKTKPREVWKLGPHTLMCGDSTKPEDFKKLMGTTKADLCWTDPPYGVSYKGTNNPNGKPWGVMTNDALRGDELYTFLEAAYKNIFEHTKEGAALYTCYASINHQVFEVALNTAGWIVKQQLIWEKGHVLGHSDYHWSHEPILYCKRGETNTTWFGDRTQKTVMLQATIENLKELKKEELIEMISKIREQSDLIKESKDPTTQYLHATQKPVNLSRRMIKNSSKPKEIVLDPFGGSGSVVMACESTSRICYCMELDPKYCDVILIRWSKYAEKDPIRSDGKKWSEL